jgi:hypothetical protein
VRWIDDKQKGALRSLKDGDLIVAKLDDEDATVRIVALLACTETLVGSDDRTAFILDRIAKEEDGSIRAICATLLVPGSHLGVRGEQTPTDATMDQLVAASSSDDKRVAAAAVRALSIVVPETDRRDFLMNRLEDPNALVRAAAVGAGGLAPDVLSRVLTHDPDPIVRSVAAVVLSLTTEAREPWLILQQSARNDPDALVRFSAISQMWPTPLTGAGTLSTLLRAVETESVVALHNADSDWPLGRALPGGDVLSTLDACASEDPDPEMAAVAREMIESIRIYQGVDPSPDA